MSIKQVKQAINAGDKAQARKLLKPILKTDPSADAWTLAAMLTDDRQQAIKCLKQAITLDEWHTTANRMLSQLEAVNSAEERGYEIDTGFQAELSESQATAQQQGNFWSNFLKGLGGLFSKPDDDDQKDTR